MEHVPFSIINEYLKVKLLHPSRYGGSKYSFLKIFQHGLYFHFTKQRKKIIFNYLNFPLSFQRFIYWLKSKFHAPPKTKATLGEYVILFPNRVIKGEDGLWRSIYFDRIVQLIGIERVTTINQVATSVIPADYNLKELAGAFSPLDKQEYELLVELNTTLHAAKKSKQFTSSELRQIRSAMHIFFEEFRLFYSIFKGQHTRKLLFVCHYHNEGMLAAAQLLGIESIEFQHGLIATNDLYYVYHEQFASLIGKAFFSDKILVYGPYWQRILENGCEFHSFQIYVAGDYLYRQSETKMNTIEKENIILVCAQKNLHDDYISYIDILLAFMHKHPDWRVVIKLHPQEKNKEIYYALSARGVEIRDVEVPLDMLLQSCKIQISIYSTTFYDALGMGVCNFSLQNYGSMSDYAKSMITEAVAYPLYADEDPIEKFLSKNSENILLTSREDVYGPFNASLIKEAIELS